VKIKRPNGIARPESATEFDAWFDEHIQPINDAFDEAVVVYGYQSFCAEDFINWQPLKMKNDKQTHKALLINIATLAFIFPLQSCSGPLKPIGRKCFMFF
jgi:hypothetical protein